jgi:hypothetical protein
VAAAAVSVAGSDAVPVLKYLAVLKEIVVDHRAEKLWLAALVARQDEEVR